MNPLSNCPECRLVEDTGRLLRPADETSSSACDRLLSLGSRNFQFRSARPSSAMWTRSRRRRSSASSPVTRSFRSTASQSLPWHDVQETSILARSTNLTVVIARPGKCTNTYELTTVVSEALGLKVLNLDPRDHPVIKNVRAGSPAEAAGLKTGDEILVSPRFHSTEPISSSS